MKQNPKRNLTHQLISEYKEMNKHFEKEGLAFRVEVPELPELNKPNPPTPEAIKRAQFVDKTYVWTGK